MSLAKELWNDEGAATMSEYALLIALIAVACIAGVNLMGSEVNRSFRRSRRSIRQAG